MSDAGGVLFLISVALMLVGPLDRALSKRRHAREGAYYGATLRAAYKIPRPDPTIETIVKDLDAVPEVRKP